MNGRVLSAINGGHTYTASQALPAVLVVGDSAMRLSPRAGL